MISGSTWSTCSYAGAESDLGGPAEVTEQGDGGRREVARRGQLDHRLERLGRQVAAGSAGLDPRRRLGARAGGGHPQRQPHTPFNSQGVALPSIGIFQNPAAVCQSMRRALRDRRLTLACRQALRQPARRRAPAAASGNCRDAVAPAPLA